MLSLSETNVGSQDEKLIIQIAPAQAQNGLDGPHPEVLRKATEALELFRRGTAVGGRGGWLLGSLVGDVGGLATR